MLFIVFVKLFYKSITTVILKLNFFNLIFKLFRIILYKFEKILNKNTEKESINMRSNFHDFRCVPSRISELSVSFHNDDINSHRGG